MPTDQVSELVDQLRDDPEALRDYIERDVAMQRFIHNVKNSAGFMAGEAQKLLAT